MTMDAPIETRKPNHANQAKKQPRAVELHGVVREENYRAFTKRVDPYATGRGNWKTAPVY